MVGIKTTQQWTANPENVTIKVEPFVEGYILYIQFTTKIGAHYNCQLVAPSLPSKSMLAVVCHWLTVLMKDEGKFLVCNTSWRYGVGQQNTTLWRGGSRGRACPHSLQDWANAIMEVYHLLSACNYFNTASAHLYMNHCFMSCICKALKTAATKR